MVNVATPAQYPYTLYYQESQDGTQLPNGNYGPSVSVWTGITSCRDEANGNGSSVTLEDGTAYTYGSVIYLPKFAGAIFDSGMSVQVRDSSGTVRLTGTVKRVYVGQLNARLFI